MRTSAIVSACLAPVVLSGGSLAAAAVQPAGSGYSSVHQTVSVLAANGAADRWVMTAALALVGACYVVTAVGMTEAHVVGRTVFAVGGGATFAVACLPQPNPLHVPLAGVAFAMLALWPALSAVPSSVAGISATLLLIVLLCWFAAELTGPWLGVTERVLAAGESLWPLLAVTSVLRARRVGVAPGPPGVRTDGPFRIAGR